VPDDSALFEVGGAAVLPRADWLGGEEQIIAAMETARDREHAG
jgi:hypothetical protein